MTYAPDDFGPGKAGPQIDWIEERLDALGVPRIWSPELLARVQLWQLSQGWTGSGADGLPGPTTLKRLAANPPHLPAGIDLSLWKVTLPIGRPDEIYPIGGHESAPWFANHGSAGVTFRAHCEGATTSGSSYPRCELREMEPDGSRAAWSNDGERHVMRGRLAITHVPEIKPHVVCAQIHDAVDDVVMVRLEGRHLFVESPYADDVTLAQDYQLGTFFDLSISASPSGIEVTYNGRSVTLPGLVRSGCYFKAGCYTQASSRVPADSPKYGTGYGEVTYTALSLSTS